MSQNSLEPQDPGWRTRTMLAGGLIGSLIGVIAAYLYVRSGDEAAESGASKPMQTRDVIKIGSALLSIVRQIAETGTKR